MSQNSLPTDVSLPKSLGDGVNSFSGARRSGAVILGDVNHGNMTTHYSYRVCHSLASVIKEIGTEAELAYKSPGFAGSSKVEFMKNLNATETSVVIIAKYENKQVNTASSVTFEAAVTSSLPPSPAPTPATALLNFYDNYGDSYVNEVHVGGEYFAAFTFLSETVSEQSTILAELSAKGIAGGGVLNGSMITQINTLQQQTNVRTNFQQTLIGYSGVSLPTTPAAIPDFVSNSLPNASTPNQTIGYKTEQYYHLPGTARAAWHPLILSLSYLNQDVVPAIEQCVAQIDAIESIQSLYNRYGYTQDAILTSSLTAANTCKTGLMTYLSSLWENPTLSPAVLPDSVSILKKGLPKPSFEINLFNLAGDSVGGGPFNDVTDYDVLESTKNLSSIGMQSGEWINAIITGYTNDFDGASEAISVKHGGSGGGYQPNLSLDVKFPATYVKSISATTNNNQNNYVDYVSVTTNAAQHNTQSWGVAGANETTWTKENNTFFIGWAGRSGEYLDHLKAQVLTFSPATWTPFD